MLRAAIGTILMLFGIVGYAAETCDYGSSPKNGLIVFSGTMSINTAIPPPIGTPSAFTYTYNHAGGGYLTQQQAWLTPDGLIHRLPSDFPDVGFGHLFILRLKAGDYEFQDWSYRVHIPAHRGQGFRRIVNADSGAVSLPIFAH